MKRACLISLWFFVTVIYGTNGNDTVTEEKDVPENSRITKLITTKESEILNVLRVCTKTTFAGTPTVTPIRYKEKTSKDKNYPKQWTWVELKITDSKQTRYALVRFFQRTKTEDVATLTHYGRKDPRDATEPIKTAIFASGIYETADTEKCRPPK